MVTALKVRSAWFSCVLPDLLITLDMGLTEETRMTPRLLALKLVN